MKSKGKITALRDGDVSPTVVLHRTLDKVDKIKSVIIVIEWDENEDYDGGWAVDWSKISSQQFSFATAVLGHKFRQHLDEIYNPDADHIG